MAGIMTLIEKLNELFESIQRENKDLTPYKISLEVGLDPSLVTKGLKGLRPFSDSTLEKLSRSPHVPYTVVELLGMRAADEYSQEVLVEGLKSSGMTSKEIIEKLQNPPLEKKQTAVSLEEALEMAKAEKARREKT